MESQHLNHDKTNTADLSRQVERLKNENSNLKQRIADLEEKESIFNEISESIPGALFRFSVDKNGKFKIPFMSKKGTEITGRPYEEITDPDKLFSLALAEDYPGLMDSIGQSATNKSAWDHTFRIKTSEGTTKWIRGYSTPQTLDAETLVWSGILLDVTGIIQTQNQLEESERKYRDIAEMLPEVVFESDIKGNLIFANQIAFEKFGYDYDDPWENLNVFNFLIPEDRPKAKEYIRGIFSGMPSTGNEYTAIRKDGSTFSAIVHSAAVIENGKPVGLRGIIIDISERKKIEKALAESEEKFKQIFNATNEAIVIHDADNGEIIETNKAFEKLFKVPKEEAENYITGDFSSGEEPYTNEEALKKINDAVHLGPQQFEWYSKDITGRYFWAEVSLKLAQIAGRKRVMAVVRDIDERKKAQQELFKTQKYLETAVEQSTAGILIADAPDVRIRVANPAALGIRSGDRENLTDIPVELHPENWQVFHPDGTQFKPDDLPLSRAVLKGETVKNVDAIIKRPGGEERWILANASPVRDEKGDIIAGIVIFPDITEQKKADLALRESEEKYKTVVNNASEGIVVIQNRKIKFANPRLLEMLDYSQKEIFSRDFDEFVHPDDRILAVDRFLKRMKGEEIDPINYFRILTRNGETIWIENNTIIIDWLGAKATLNIMTDITERKKATEDLKVSEQKFRSIIESSPMGIHLYELRDDDLIFIGANPSADRILGVDNSRFIGMKIEEAFPPLKDTEVPKRYREAAEYGRLWQTQQIDYKDNKIKGAFEVYAFRTSPGKIAVMFLDVTGRKKSGFEINEPKVVYKRPKVEFDEDENGDTIIRIKYPKPDSE